MAPMEVLWRQRIPVALILILGAVVTAFTALSQKTRYAATATVLYTGYDVGGGLGIGQLDMTTLATSETVAMRTMRALHMNESVADFTAAVSTRPAYQSNVLPITFSSADPGVAIAAVNELVVNLRDYFREITLARFDGLSTYLDGALRKRKRQVVELDKRLNAAAAGDPTLATDDAVTTLNEQLSTLMQERDHAAADLTGSQAQVAADGQHLGDIEPLARQEIAGRDYVYRALQAQQAGDAAQLSSQRAQFTPLYPGIRGLTKKVQREGASVEQRLSALDSHPPEESLAYVGALAGRDYHTAEVAGGQAQVAAYDREIDKVREELARYPSEGPRIAALRRERDTARSAYDTLAQRRELMLAEQAQAATTGTIEIINKAESADVTSKRGQLLNIGAALGFVLLAVTVAFLLDSADRRMRGIDSIADVYGKPVIATLKAS